MWPWLGKLNRKLTLWRRDILNSCRKLFLTFVGKTFPFRSSGPAFINSMGTTATLMRHSTIRCCGARLILCQDRASSLHWVHLVYSVPMWKSILFPSISIAHGINISNAILTFLDASTLSNRSWPCACLNSRALCYSPGKFLFYSPYYFPSPSPFLFLFF